MVRGRKNPLCHGCGTRLRLLREAGGISGVRLAGASGVNTSSISMLINGQRMMGIDTIEQLATALSVSPAWLAFGPEGLVPFRQKRARTGMAPAPAPVPRLVDLRTRSTRHEGCPDRLLQSRQQKGLSYRALARASGISNQAIQNTELRTTVPKVQTLEAIAVALDVSPGWLAYGEGSSSEVSQTMMRNKPASGRGVCSVEPAQQTTESSPMRMGGCSKNRADR